MTPHDLDTSPKPPPPALSRYNCAGCDRCDRTLLFTDKPDVMLCRDCFETEA